MDNAPEFREEAFSPRLSGDELLVLFELLGRWDYTSLDSSNIPPVNLVDDAEWWVANNLYCELEKRIVSAFRPDYLDQVAAAKARIIKKCGNRPQ